MSLLCRAYERSEELQSVGLIARDLDCWPHYPTYGGFSNPQNWAFGNHSSCTAALATACEGIDAQSAHEEQHTYRPRLWLSTEMLFRAGRIQDERLSGTRYKWAG